MPLPELPFWKAAIVRFPAGNLESLYRVTHQNSLDGLQDLLVQARADLAGGNGKPAPVTGDSAEPGSE